MTFTLREAPTQIYSQIDLHGMLPHLGGCDRAKPAKPARIPTQEPQRSKVLGFLARGYTLMEVPPEQIDGVLAQLENDAAALAWPSLIPTIVVLGGHAYLRAGMVDKARASYERAQKLVEGLGDQRIEAEVYVGLLDASMNALARPATDALTRLDGPRTAPVLHPELALALVLARGSTKDDPMLAGAIESMAALAYQQLAQNNRYPVAYIDALTRAEAARKFFETNNDARRLTQIAATEAAIYLERGDDRALDDAFFVTRRASDALTAAALPPSRELDEIRIEIAFLRGQYAEAHRLIAQHMPVKPSHLPTTITGKVTPPGRVTVIAWRGDLVGDPRRGYFRPDAEAMDVVQTRNDGTFTIHAEPGWAVLAEGADQRSLPQVIGGGTLALTLHPTTTLSGTVAGKNLFGVHAFARYRTGTNAWTLEVPVESEGVYDLRGLPEGGEPELGTRGTAGHGVREVRAAARALTWPTGQSLEIIVRAPALASASEVVVTSAALDRAVAPLRRVGSSATDAGRELYQPGDRHAVITGNASGKVTACVAKACKTIELMPSIVIDYPDGRYAAGVTPIVLEP